MKRKRGGQPIQASASRVQLNNLLHALKDRRKKAAKGAYEHKKSWSRWKSIGRLEELENIVELIEKEFIHGHTEKLGN